MKLTIKEGIINEAIADIKKYYPNIPDNVFMQLIELDPTYRGNDSAGKYGKWLLNLYNKGNLSEDNFEDATTLLNQFNMYRNRIQNKDLNSYKSLDALAEVLAAVVDDDSMLTDRQKLRFLKKVKRGELKTVAENDYDVILETPNFIVYSPNTHEASMMLGRGTKWCTAHENPDWYNDYTSSGHKLFIIKDKKTGERWQYSDKNHDFLDETDEEFDVIELIQRDEQLFNLYTKWIGFDLRKSYVYKGGEVIGHLRDYITDVVIDDTVTAIDDDAFYGCTKIETVTIPNSVTSIGECAFYSCTNLKTINIPDSIKTIGDFAFLACESLLYIDVPDSVIKLGLSTFEGCTSMVHIRLSNNIGKIPADCFGGCNMLINVTLPKSTKQIGTRAFMGCEQLSGMKIYNNVDEIKSNAFDDCNNLIIHTDNEYVQKYCEQKNIKYQPMYNGKESFDSRKNGLIVKESIRRLETEDVLLTDWVGDVVNLLINKPAPYRIVYNEFDDIYLIANADRVIHEDMTEAAWAEGWLPKSDKLMKDCHMDIDEFDAYHTTNLIFLRPEDITEEFGGYTDVYETSEYGYEYPITTGSIFTKARHTKNYFEDAANDLYNKLKRYAVDVPRVMYDSEW